VALCFLRFGFEAEDEVRMALATTACEDLPPVCVGPLLELTCPELVDTEDLVKVETKEGLGKSGKMLALMEKVCRGNENKDNGLRERLTGEGGIPQGAVLDSLLRVRTCMLLQYMTVIGLVWQQLASSEEEIDGDAKEETS